MRDYESETIALFRGADVDECAVIALGITRVMRDPELLAIVFITMMTMDPADVAKLCEALRVEHPKVAESEEYREMRKARAEVAMRRMRGVN